MYPNNAQEETLKSLLGSCRFVYNKCLILKEEAYKQNQTILGLNELSKYFHGTLRNENVWLCNINTKIIKQSIINLDKAYKNYFKFKFGHPKLKTKKQVDRVRLPNEVIPKIMFGENLWRINLSTGLKGVRFACSEKDRDYVMQNRSGIRSISVSKRKCGHYYASILINGDIKRTLPKPMNNFVGIDLGVKSFLTLSNGDQVSNIRLTKRFEQKIIRMQRIMSRRKIGGQNRNKTRIKIAKLYERICNIRKNYIDTIISKIINDNQVVVLETLNVHGMMQNHKLSKAIHDVGFSMFCNSLKYRAGLYNRDVVEIDQWFPSSKKCSCCGHVKDDLLLQERTYVCNICGMSIDRDVNAAKNILLEGVRLYKDKIGKRVAEYTPVEMHSLETSLKQEGENMLSVA